MATGGIAPPNWPTTTAAPSPSATAEKAFDFCLQAGDVAARQYAWEEACGHYQRALDVEPLLPVPAEGQRGAVAGKVYEEMGDAFALAGAFDRSVDAYESAAARLPKEDRIAAARVKQKQMLPLYRRGQYDLALVAVTQAEIALGSNAAEGAGSGWWQEWIEVELDRSLPPLSGG